MNTSGISTTAVLTLGLLVGAPGRAATVDWSGGSGTWDTTDLNWGGAGASTLWDSVTGPGNIASFAGISEPADAAIDEGGVFAANLTLSGAQGVTLAGAGQLKLSNLLSVNGGANLTLAGSARLDLAVTAGPYGNYINVGTSGTGTLTVQDTALVYTGFDRYLTTGVGGTITVSGGDIAAWRVYFAGASTINIDGGNLVSKANYDDALNTSRNGDWRSTTGTQIAMSSGRLGGFNWSQMGLCTFNISGGLFLAGGNNNNEIGSGGVTTFNLTGGEVRWADRTLAGGSAASDFNLGGTSLMMMRSVTPGAGTVSFNFDGGTLQKLGSSDAISFMPASVVANVMAGGAKLDTAGIDVTIEAPLLHDAGLGDSPDGGLSKSGAGTLLLAGGNTYTGDTTVTEGTLSISTDFLADTSAVRIAGSGAFLDLAHSLSDTVSQLFIDGIQQPAGDYTSTTPQITGAGTLHVLSGGGGSTYADWIATKAPATGFVTDSDRDGVPNGVENILNSDPNIYSAGLTRVSATSTSVTFQHTLNPAPASDVAASYQWSTDLVEWKGSTETNSGGTTATITPAGPVAGVVTVTVKITSGPATKLFGRLVASKH